MPFVCMPLVPSRPFECSPSALQLSQVADRPLQAGCSLVKFSRHLFVQVNVVVMRGVNDDEIADFVELTRDRPINVRFIEYMPFDGNVWSDTKMVTYKQMMAAVQQRFPDELQRLQVICILYLSITKLALLLGVTYTDVWWPHMLAVCLEEAFAVCCREGGYNVTSVCECNL